MICIAILIFIGVLIEAQIAVFVNQLEPLVPFNTAPEVKLQEESRNILPLALPLPAVSSMPEVAPFVPGTVSSMPGVVPSMPEIVPPVPEIIPSSPELMPSVLKLAPSMPQEVPSVPVVAPPVPVAAPYSVPMYLPFSIYFENEKGPPCPPCMCQPACTPAFFSYCSPCHQICRCRLENLISQQLDWSCGVKVPC